MVKCLSKNFFTEIKNNSRRLQTGIFLVKRGITIPDVGDIRAKEDHITGAENFNTVADDSFAGTVEDVDEFALGMKVERCIKIGHISFNKYEAFLRGFANMSKKRLHSLGRSLKNFLSSGWFNEIRYVQLVAAKIGIRLVNFANDRYVGIKEILVLDLPMPVNILAFTLICPAFAFN